MARNFVKTSSNRIEYTPRVAPGTVYTVATRFKMTTLGSAFHTLFGQRSTTNASTASFMLAVNDNNELRWFVISDDAADVVDLRAAAPTIGVWTTLVGTRNGSDFEIFKNGVSIDTVTKTMGTISSDDLLLIGAAVNGSTTRVSFSDADIADCAVWTVELTADEIAAYDKGVSPTMIRGDKLVFYSPCWGTTLENDLSGSAKVGVLTDVGGVSTTNPVAGSYKKRSIFNQTSLLKKREIDHAYVEQLAEVTQSNTTMTTKLSIPSSFFVPFARYLIITSAQIGADSTGQAARVQLTFNGDAPLLGTLSEYRLRGTESTRRRIYHDVRVVDVDDTPTSFDFQISNGATNTTRASNIQIFAMRLDKHFKEGVDYFYKDEIGNISMDPIAGRNIRSVFTEAFKLDSAEDFYTMGTCRYETPSVSQRGFINPQLDLGSLGGGGEVANVGGLDFNQTYHALKNVSSGVNHRFNMSCTNGGAGSDTFTKFVSIFAIKTALFEDLIVSDAQSGDILITGADTYQTILSGSFTPTQGGAYVTFYGVRVVFQSGSTTGSRRANLRFQLDNVSNPINIDVNTLTDPQGVDDSPSIPMIAYYGNLPKVSHDWKMEGKNLLANQVRVANGNIIMFSLLPLSRFSIQGVVKEEGSPVARTVRAFLSSTGELVGETTSNAGDGAYEICDLPGGNIFVMAFDDSGGSSFNAQVFDKVIPV